ncbi:MAG TPA: DUF4234 domain-containing protein [Flavobacterium sp.]|jgi:hypothetical protein
MSENNSDLEIWNEPINPQPPIPVFKEDPIVVLLLGFITCGLYLIYWNIKVAEVFNAVSRREVISQPIAIFAGCCYPVNIYFFYIAGKEALPDVYKRSGAPAKDDTTLLLVLGFFFPMAAAMIVQSDINKLYN